MTDKSFEQMMERLAKISTNVIDRKDEQHAREVNMLERIIDASEWENARNVEIFKEREKELLKKYEDLKTKGIKMLAEKDAKIKQLTVAAFAQESELRRFREAKKEDAPINNNAIPMPRDVKKEEFEEVQRKELEKTKKEAEKMLHDVKKQLKVLQKHTEKNETKLVEMRKELETEKELRMAAEAVMVEVKMNQDFRGFTRPIGICFDRNHLNLESKLEVVKYHRDLIKDRYQEVLMTNRCGRSSGY